MSFSDPSGKVYPRDPSPGKGLVAGLIGGLAGSLAMVAFQGAWSRTVEPRMRPAEDDTAGDFGARTADPSTIRGARSLARLVGDGELSTHQGKIAGRAFHFAFGTGMGGAYGVLVEYVRFASVGSGVPFGALQMFFADEVSVPALELSEAPARAPLSAHVGSLAARIVYSLTTEQVRRAVRARL